MSDEMVVKQNKEKINATVSKRLKDKAMELSDGNFSSFVGEAIAYYSGALDKEITLRLERAETDLKSLQAEYSEMESALLKLVSNHPELLQEFNELKKRKPRDTENTRKVKFE